jgi:membrane protein implicated in regulation of membrane protease activity
MDLGSADTWRWIWLAAVTFFALGELLAPGTFFLVSFAVGAIAAAVLAFAGVDLVWQWVAFVVVSGASLVILVPIGRRLERNHSGTPVGATRWEGRRAVVVEAIPAGLHESGLVRVGRDPWRAESDDGSAIEVGATVSVVRVDGTHMVVRPAADVINDPRS